MCNGNGGACSFAESGEGGKNNRNSGVWSYDHRTRLVVLVSRWCALFCFLDHGPFFASSSPSFFSLVSFGAFKTDQLEKGRGPGARVSRFSLRWRPKCMVAKAALRVQLFRHVPKIEGSRKGSRQGMWFPIVLSTCRLLDWDSLDHDIVTFLSCWQLHAPLIFLGLWATGR